MRKLVVGPMVVLLAVLAFSSGVTAQAPKGQDQAPADIAPGVPAMLNPPGPAPKQDLTGAWIGPQPKNLVVGPFAAMTPAGEAKFKLNKPVNHVSDTAPRVEATNDPFMMCDPLGLPRDLRSPSLNGRGGMRFAAAPDRMLI